MVLRAIAQPSGRGKAYLAIMDNVSKNKSKAKRITLWATLAVVLLLVLSVVAYCFYFSGKGLPRTSVAGFSITGKSRPDVAKEMTQRLNDTKVNVEVNGEQNSYALSDLGVNVDVDATVKEAFAKNSNFLNSLGALFKSRNVEPVTTTDEAKQKEALDALIAKTGVPAENPAVKFDEAEGVFKAGEGKSGNAIDVDKVKETLDKAIDYLSTQDISLTTSQVEPSISVEQATETANKANELLKLSASIQGRAQAYEANAATKAGWVQIEAEDDAYAAPKLNGDKITEWVNEVAAAEKVEAKNGVRNVSESGDVLAVAVEAVDGYTVKNADAVANEAVAKLQDGQNYAGKFEFDVTKAEHEDKVVAEGAENLAYAAAPGEKWLVINLGNNTSSAYEGATLVRGPMLIVPGMPGAETVTGKFNVYLKYNSQTMRGTHPDGSRYVVPNVRWVTYFHGSYAFHYAPWQTSFGWSGPGGSNGCINMNEADSKFIYDWAPMGTVVVSHY